MQVFDVYSSLSIFCCNMLSRVHGVQIPAAVPAQNQHLRLDTKNDFVGRDHHCRLADHRAGAFDSAAAGSETCGHGTESGSIARPSAPS
jgi:hypothetical protein